VHRCADGGCAVGSSSVARRLVDRRSSCRFSRRGDDVAQGAQAADLSIVEAGKKTSSQSLSADLRWRAVNVRVGAARRGDFDVLPAMWMLLYGAGVITGGAFSVRLVPTMGACFMVAVAFGLLFPAWQNVLLAISFGGLHLVFGALISKNHGG
jgi:Flp pilus assembly protein TadB